MEPSHSPASGEVVKSELEHLSWHQSWFLISLLSSLFHTQVIPKSREGGRCGGPANAASWGLGGMCLLASFSH
jgi:hypothetical protein